MISCIYIHLCALIYLFLVNVRTSIKKRSKSEGEREGGRRWYEAFSVFFFLELVIELLLENEFQNWCD